MDAECARHFAGHYTTAARLQHLLDMGHIVVRELASGRLMADAGKLHVPTLILWGRQDRLVPVQHGFDLQRRLPHAQLYLFDDCGHCPQLERPAEFGATVDRFLRGARAATSARIVGADQLGA